VLKNNLTQNEKLGAVYESKRDFKTHGTSFIVIGGLPKPVYNRLICGLNFFILRFK
jgi:hypothetical protein